jgi:hypothetical protein
MECPICLYAYDLAEHEPRLLPCDGAHDICVQCVDEIRADVSIPFSCPVCREVIPAGSRINPNRGLIAALQPSKPLTSSPPTPAAAAKSNPGDVAVPLMEACKITLECSQCAELLPKDAFSRAQQGKRAAVRRCKSCVAGGDESTLEPSAAATPPPASPTKTTSTLNASSTPKTAKKSSKKKPSAVSTSQTSAPFGPQIPYASELPDFDIDKTYDHPVMVKLPSEALVKLLSANPILTENTEMVGLIMNNELMSEAGRMEAIERLAKRLGQPQKPRQCPGTVDTVPGMLAMSEKDAKEAEEEIGLLERRVEIRHGAHEGCFGTVEQLDACGTSVVVNVTLPSGGERLICVPAKHVEVAQFSLQGGWMMQNLAFPSDVPSLGTVCATCGRHPAKSSCSKCQRARYCSKECQVEGWKSGHKASCKASRPLAAQHGRSVGDHVAVLVDLLRELKGSGVEAVLEILLCLEDCTSPMMVSDTCALLNAGAARALVAACARCPDSLDVQRSAVRLLSQISGDRERPRKPGALEVFVAGGLDIVARALHAFPDDNRVQYYGHCVLSSVAGMRVSTNRLVAKRCVQATNDLVELPLMALRAWVVGSFGILMRATSDAGAADYEDALRNLSVGLPAFASLSSILHDNPEPLFESCDRLDLIIMCTQGLASCELARLDATKVGSSTFSHLRMPCLAYACRTLANSIVGNHARKAKVGERGGAKAAVAAMRASNDMAVQADGCMLLRNLMSATPRGSPSMSAGGSFCSDAFLGMAPDVVAAGGVEMLHRALTLHPKDAFVTTAALGALFNLYNDAAMSGDPRRIPATLLESWAQASKDAAKRASQLHKHDQQIVMTAKVLIDSVDGAEGFIPGVRAQTLRR